VQQKGNGPATARLSTGLGTRIVETLAGQINAMVANERLPKGFKVTVTVPRDDDLIAERPQSNVEAAIVGSV
jgi:hypothetical protein